MRVSKVVFTVLTAAFGVAAALAFRLGNVTTPLPPSPPVIQMPPAEAHIPALPAVVVAADSAQNEAARTMPAVVRKSESQTLSEQIDVLVAAGRIGDARVQAELFLTRFPDDPDAAHIESLTGVHSRPGLFGSRIGRTRSSGENP